MVSASLDFSVPQAWAFHAATADSEDVALGDFRNAVKRLGFANVALFHDAPPHPNFVDIRVISGYMVHPEIHPRLGNQGPSPKVARCIANGSCEAVNVLEDRKHAPNQQIRAQLEMVLDAGITSGLFVAARDRRTNLATMVSAESLDTTDEFVRLARSVSKRVHIALTYFREGLCVNNLQRQADQPVLLSRERECLAWVAAGKTTSEIGDLANLADSTVNDYIASACKKLKASHRAQAAARAMLLTETM